MKPIKQWSPTDTLVERDNRRINRMADRIVIASYIVGVLALTYVLFMEWISAA